MDAIVQWPGCSYESGCSDKDYVEAFNFRVHSPFYLVLILEGRSFDHKLNLCLKHRIASILLLFEWIFNAYPISRPFLMKICVKYLRYDSYKITLQMLTTPMDEVVIGSTFIQVSNELFTFVFPYNNIH